MTALPNKTKELIFLFLYLALSPLAIYFIKPNYLLSFLIFAGVPTIALLLKLKNLRKKIIFESLVLVIPAVLPFDYISHHSSTWYIPSVSGIRILGAFPIEEFIWIFIYLLFVLSVYEYFFDSVGIKKVSPKFKLLILFLIGILVAFFILILLTPLLNIKYFYFIWMAAFSFFILTGFAKYPKLAKHILPLTAFLIIPSLIFEIISLKLGHWWFPYGNHIGYIDILGTTFPVEEALFFLVAPCFSLLIHEIFADNRRN